MRDTRSIVPGVTYHLVSRFVDRGWFVQHPEEREQYLILLGRSLALCDWRALGYAILSDQIHLAAIAGRVALDSWIGPVHGSFAAWMNKRHARLGPLFARGPTAYTVPPRDERKVLAFIHNSPVHAGVVASAQLSSWTSHRAYVGLAPAPAWLHVSEGLARCGFSDPADFDRWIDSQSPPRPPAAIRRRPANVAIAARPRIRPLPRQLVAAAAREIGLSEHELRSARRLPRVIAGRRLAVHAALSLGLAGCDIASALGITPSAVSRIHARPLAPAELARCNLVVEQLLERVRQA